MIIAAYELLWRHFSAFGSIEDIYLLPNDNIAFVRFKHRCMAEFAKECLADQSLDSDEVLTIQWSETDCFELDDAKYQELKDTVDIQQQKEKEEQNRGKKIKKINPRNPEKKRRGMREYEEEQEQIKKIEDHFEKQSSHPTKKVIEAEYAIFEQKLI